MSFVQPDTRFSITRHALRVSLVVLVVVSFPSESFAEPPCSSPEARQFDFWIGEWDVENLQPNVGASQPSAWSMTGVARDIVYAVAGGCGIVEHWRGALSEGIIRGFSLRAYDPDSRKWQLVLNWPKPPERGTNFFTLEGSFEHGRGEFFAQRETAEGQTIDVRYTFSDIAADRLRWDLAISADGRTSWRPLWIMRMSRRNPLGDSRIMHTPSILQSNARLCDSGNHLDLDPFLGSWSSQDGAMVQVLPILDGCAQIEFMEFPHAGASAKIFRVRAFDPDSNRWVQYAIDSRDGRITRMEGNVISGKLTVTAAPHGGEMREIRNLGNGRLLWELQTRTGGADWQTVQRMELSDE